MFANKSVTKLAANVCDRCLRRLAHRWKGPDRSEKIRVYRKSDQFLCIESPKMAKLVAKHVKSGLHTDDVVVFESNPGTGLLTRQLLETSVQSIRVFEENPKFLEKLRRLQKQYPKRLQIIDKQLFNYKSHSPKNWSTLEYDMNEWFRGIAVQEWRSLPNILVVAMFLPKNLEFLRYLIKLLIKRELFFGLGRAQLCLLVPEREHKHMTAKPATNYSHYLSVSVLYNTLFDIETLETIDYKELRVYNKDSNQLTTMEGIAKLVRLTPKADLDQMDGQTLADYYNFVRQTFMKRKNFVIPLLETWFPNCGPDLIHKGIPVFKYFGDLKPEEVLELFNYFRGRSDYQTSFYKMLSNETLMEYNENVDIKDDEEDNDEDKDDGIDSKDKSELIE